MRRTVEWATMKILHRHWRFRSIGFIAHLHFPSVLLCKLGAYYTVPAL